MTLDRVLSLAGDDLPELRGSRMDSIRVFLLLNAVVEISLTHAYDDTSDHLFRFLLPLALIVWFGVSFVRSLRRPATLAAAITMFVVVAWRLPATPNHYLIAAIALLFLAVLDTDRPEESHLCLQGLRWLIVIVLCVSGLQKLAYGTYFRADFLTFAMAANEYFAMPFEHLLPAEELARVRSLGGNAAGAGPYGTGWLPLVAASNLVWVFEIAGPLLLLRRSTRAIALSATVLFLMVIEVSAREVFFGAISVNLLLLFARRDWNSRLLPAFVLLYGILIASKLGLLPGFFFT